MMKNSSVLLWATAIFVIGSMPLTAQAQYEGCIVVYQDYNFDVTENEVEATAFVEDYFDGICSGGYGGYYEHYYHASVAISSPTQASVVDSDDQSSPYGGGSAYASKSISFLEEPPGNYSIKWILRIICDLGGVLIDIDIDDVLEIYIVEFADVP